MHPLKLLLLNPALLSSLPIFFLNSLRLYFILSAVTLLITWPIIKALRFPYALYGLHFILFLVLAFSAYDLKAQTFFVPGFGINLDSINILASVDILNRGLNQLNNVAFQVGQSVLNSYPLGGTYLTLLFSRLLQQPPYQIYPRLIIYFYLLILFPAFALFRRFIDLKNQGSIILLWLATLATAFNYLSLSVINTGVLGSTLGSVIVYTFITFLILNKRSFTVSKYIWLSLLVLLGVYVYSYYTLFYLLLAAIVNAVFRPAPIRWQPLFAIGISIFIALLLPPIRHSLINPLNSNLYSSSSESNLFGGMLGHTTGYIHPLTSISLWFGRSDPRDPVPTSFTLLFTLGFLCLFIYLIKNNLHKIRLNRFAIILLLTSYLLPLFIARFITQSPYQYLKTLQFFSVAVPSLVVLLLIPLNSRLKQITLAFYLVIAFSSSLYAYKYISSPPADTYTAPFAVTPCRQTQSPSEPINWYDYHNLKCE